MVKVVKRMYLDNKSRKGWYYYIRYDNMPARYYKTNPVISGDAFIEHYENMYVHKGSSEHKVKPNLRESMRRHKIPEAVVTKGLNTRISKGMGVAKISNVFSVSQFEIKDVTKELLRPLVGDEGILDLLANDENMIKLKTRMEHKIKITDVNNNHVADISCNNKTVKQVIDELRNLLRKGETLKGFSPKIKAKMSTLDYHYHHVTDGDIENVSMVSIFRKGR